MRWATAGLFVSLAAVWGVSFVATRAALPSVPPLPLAALWFDVVAGFPLVAVGVLLIKRRAIRTELAGRGGGGGERVA